MSAIAVAGVGLMVVCSSSLAAVMMMGGEEETPATTTSAGPSAGPSGPVVPKPTGLYTTQQGLRHQSNNPEDGKTENLWYASQPGTPWAKHYKFACEDPEGNESEKVGPYGPITNGPYGKPQIRFAPKDTKPCDPNKVVIYRSDTADGTYTDITPGVSSLDHNVAYDRVKPAFYDFNE
jgi:hypothetical protein